MVEYEELGKTPRQLAASHGLGASDRSRGRGVSLCCWRWRDRGLRAAFFAMIDFLIEPRRFTRTIAQEIKPGPPDMAGAHDFNFFNTRGMKRDASLDTNTKGNFTNGKHLGEAMTADADNRSFKSLETFAVAFHDFQRHADLIAHAKNGKIRSLTVLLFHHVHCNFHRFLPFAIPFRRDLRR